MFNYSSLVNKCIEILERGFGARENFILLWQAYENVVEKNLAGFSSNTRIIINSKRFSFFGVAKPWQIVFKNKCYKAFKFLKSNLAVGRGNFT